MAVRIVYGGLQTVGTPLSPGYRTVGGTTTRTISRGGGGGGQTTYETPTPSAEQLYGTAAEREAQIQAYRSGGQAALDAAVKQAKVAEQQRIETQRQQEIKAQQERQKQIEAGTLKGQIKSKLSSAASSVKSFLFTKPSFETTKDQGIVSKGAQRFKYYAFQPLAGIGQEIRKAGSEIKGERFKGSSILGTTIGGIGSLVPETPAGQASVVVGGKAISMAPKVARIGIGSTFSYLGGKSALDPTLTPEQRVAGGIVSVGAGAGTAFESVPYIKGTAYRFSPSYKPVKVQPEGFKAIELSSKDTSKIGLILEKSPLKQGKTTDVELPKTSPLVRGGFGVKQQEKSLFIGKDQTVATSQIGLFKLGKEVPFEREFFVSPQEPSLKIPETRLSRLGLEEPFKPALKSEIGFGFPKQPQIGIERGATVARTEKAGAYRIGKGTELEAIKSRGVIKEIKPIGKTTIKGQGVDIYEFKTSPAKRNIIEKSIRKAPRSTKTISRVSGEVVTSSSIGISRIKPTTVKPTISKPSVSISYPKPSYPKPFYNEPSYPKPTPTPKTVSPSMPNYPKSSLIKPQQLINKQSILTTRKMGDNSIRQRIRINEKSKRKFYPGKPITKYQPSLTSLTFGITATKQPRIAGLSVRPIVIPKKKKKKGQFFFIRPRRDNRKLPFWI